MFIIKLLEIRHRVSRVSTTHEIYHVCDHRVIPALQVLTRLSLCLSYLCEHKFCHNFNDSIIFLLYSQLQVESRSSKCPSVLPSVRPYHYISCSFYRILSISHTGHHYNVAGVMEETFFFFSGYVSGHFRAVKKGLKI